MVEGPKNCVYQAFFVSWSNGEVFLSYIRWIILRVLMFGWKVLGRLIATHSLYMYMIGEAETFHGRGFAYTCPPVAGILRVLEPAAAHQLQRTTSTSYSNITMLSRILSVLALSISIVNAFRDTSPFFLFSTSEFVIPLCVYRCCPELTYLY